MTRRKLPCLPPREPAKDVGFITTTRSIHRLPLELLEHIFHVGALGDPSGFPTVVSHVSSLWRDIALSGTDLWGYVDFSGSDPLAKAKLWVQRSKNRPLRVVLSVREGFSLGVEDAMAFVKPQLHRCGSLTLHLDPEPLQLALGLCDEPAPALTHLSISCTEPDAIDEIIPIFGEKTPMLKSLHIEHVPFHWSGPLFGGLTDLELRCYNEDIAPSLEQVVGIFRRCPGMRRLVLDRILTVTETTCIWNQETLVMHELEYLRLASSERDLKLWFVIKMLAPKLHTWVGDPEYHDAEFRDIIRRELRGTPFPNLKRLRMEYATPYGPGFREMLTRMKVLTTVEFYQCNLSDDMIKPLVYDESTPRGRSLRELRFEASGGFTLEALKNAILSRLVGPLEGRIQVLIIRGCCCICPLDGELLWFHENVPVFEWKL